jgi:hypothetical protein
MTLAKARCQDFTLDHPVRNKPAFSSEHLVFAVARRPDEQEQRQRGLADPSRLKRLDADDKEMLRVVIENPKGSRNKFAFNPNEHIFELKKVLPSGMAFPYDFRICSLHES